MSEQVDDGETDAERRTFQLYIDESGRIAMARGNADRWLGEAPSDLEGRYITEFAAEESQFAISEILAHAALREFLPGSLFFLKETRTGSVSGFEVTGKPQNFNDLFRLNFVQDPTMEYGPQSKNSRQGFVGAVERAIQQAVEADRDIDMTFLDIGDVGRLSSVTGVDSEGVRRFTERVEDRLRESSLDGETVGRVDAGKYGVVHGRDLDLDGLRNELQSYARDIDPEGQALEVAASTVALESDNLETSDIRTALEFAVDEFADTGIDAVIFDTLADSQASYLDRKETRTALLTRCLEEDVLTCAFVPVCDIENWTAHHLIAEFRANLEDDGLGAAEILKLTDGDHDLRGQVDGAQCRYILTHDDLGEIAVAVNVALRSLLDPGVIGMLLDFKTRNTERRVILRLSGLDEIPWEKVQALSILRRAGFQIALHGGDVGAVTAEKLESLPADYIILDPSFVVNLDQLKRALPMLANMVKRCAEYDIRIVFEGLLEASAARMLSKVSGALCGGAYFGDPVENLESLKLPVR
jgi:EAL domain-containing protein (putative c-di-GMP-specific phosphodiesterase class I)